MGKYARMSIATARESDADTLANYHMARLTRLIMGKRACTIRLAKDAPLRKAIADFYEDWPTIETSAPHARAVLSVTVREVHRKLHPTEQPDFRLSLEMIGASTMLLQWTLGRNGANFGKPLTTREMRLNVWRAERDADVDD